MRAFLLTSGTFFSFIALAWAARLTFAWPVEVNGWSVPVAASVVPVLIAGSFAVWAFTLARRAPVR